MDILDGVTLIDLILMVQALRTELLIGSCILLLKGRESFNNTIKKLPFLLSLSLAMSKDRKISKTNMESSMTLQRLQLQIM